MTLAHLLATFAAIGVVAYAARLWLDRLDVRARVAATLALATAPTARDRHDCRLPVDVCDALTRQDDRLERLALVGFGD